MIEQVKDNCTGCNACIYICKKNALRLKVTEEGFWYPVIDREKCVHCQNCSKVCPVLNQNSNLKNLLPKTYAARNLDERILLNSSSGGIFYAVAHQILKEGGVVFGACYDYISHSVKHRMIVDMQEISVLMGSKYVQSYIDPEIYSELQQKLLDGKKVLFSGTPCQVAAVKSSLFGDYENLFLIDIVCHGVPSPKAWLSYIKSMENRGYKDISHISFRTKSIGWKKYEMELKTKEKRYNKWFNDDDWGKAFINNIFLRKCCYNCSFKKFPREGDISLGDFWGIEDQYNPKDLGCSLVLINTNKGEDVLTNVSQELQLYEMPLESAFKGNYALQKSSSYFEERDRAFYFLNQGMDFGLLIKKLLEPSMMKRVVRKIKRIFYKNGGEK